MTWSSWMRSRALRGVVAGAMALPMGAPSAFAAYRLTDELRTESASVADGGATNPITRVEEGIAPPPVDGGVSIATVSRWISETLRGNDNARSALRRYANKYPVKAKQQIRTIAKRRNDHPDLLLWEIGLRPPRGNLKVPKNLPVVKALKPGQVLLLNPDEGKELLMRLFNEERRERIAVIGDDTAKFITVSQSGGELIATTAKGATFPIQPGDLFVIWPGGDITLLRLANLVSANRMINVVAFQAIVEDQPAIEAVGRAFNMPTSELAPSRLVRADEVYPRIVGFSPTPGEGNRLTSAPADAAVLSHRDAIAQEIRDKADQEGIVILEALPEQQEEPIRIASMFMFGGAVQRLLLAIFVRPEATVRELEAKLRERGGLFDLTSPAAVQSALWNRLQHALAQMQEVRLSLFGSPEDRGDLIRRWARAYERVRRALEQSGKSWERWVAEDLQLTGVERDNAEAIFRDWARLGQYVQGLHGLVSAGKLPKVVQQTSGPGLLHAVLPVVRLTYDDAGNTRLSVREDRQEDARQIVSDLQALDGAPLSPDPSRRWLIAELAEDLGTEPSPVAPRIPPRELAEALENAITTTVVHRPSRAVPAPEKDNATAIAAATLHLRGDLPTRKDLKDTAAQRASDAVTIARGDLERVMAVEGRVDVGLGELQEGGVHKTGIVVNPRGLGKKVSVLRDDIEVTAGFHTDREGKPRNRDTSFPGSTTLRAWGEKVESHGVVPETYALFVAANVPPDKLEEYRRRPLDPFFPPDDEDRGLSDQDALNRAVRKMIERLAGDNNRRLDEVEVVILKREREEAVLRALQQIEGLTITQISDGTVDPARLAMAGRKEGKYLITIGTAKSTEATHNGFESAVLLNRGAVFGMRPVSENIGNVFDEEGKVVKGAKATDHSNRLRWGSEEAASIRGFRADKDAEKILKGEQLYDAFYFAELAGDVEIAVAHLTDNPWFDLPGARLLADGDTVRVVTTRLSSKAARKQGADLWVEVGDVSRRGVLETVARAPWASHDPAAADLSVVDPDGRLLALMEGKTEYTILLGNPEALSSKSPLLWMQIQQALEEFRRRKGLKSLAEAAQQSAVKFIIDAGPTMSVDERGVPVARVTLLSNASWDAEGDARWAVGGQTFRREFPEEEIEVEYHEVTVDEAKGLFYVHVDLIGAKAAEAARYLHDHYRPMRDRMEQAAEKRVRRLFDDIAAGTKLSLPGKPLEGETFPSAARPEPGWFRVMTNPAVLGKKVDAVIGTTAYLKAMPASIKPSDSEAAIAFDESPEDGKALAGASAVVAAVVAVDVSKRDPEVVKRLKLTTDAIAGFSKPTDMDVAEDTAQSAQTYQTAVAESAGKV